MLALALSVLVAATPPAASLEREAALILQREYERVGRRAPEVDEALSRAARRLAGEALHDSPSGAVALLPLLEAVSDSGGADPTPRSIVIRTWSHSHVLSTLQAREDLSREPASHAGVGVVVEGERAALVVLLAQRKARLQPFPRTLQKPPASRTLCGELMPSLQRPEIFVTLPEGRVERMPLSRQQGSSFCTRLVFITEGRYTVEVVGSGELGPEVAALFLVDVGARQRSLSEQVEEPTTVEQARAAVLERINSLRRAHGLRELAMDGTLTLVAQAYSERMGREGFFGHVAPDGSDLRGRLKAAGANWRVAGENLGMGPGPLAAHFGIEHSPGHRHNLLGSQFTHAGIGVLFQEVSGYRQAIITEVFSAPSQPVKAPVNKEDALSQGDALSPEDALSQAYRALASRRAAHRLPELERSVALESIAQEHARLALAQDVIRPQVAGSHVHERVFSTLKAVGRTSVDIHILDDPGELPDSRGLTDARNGLVGVGLVRGDSPTHGKERYWVVVIYAGRR
jgi:uncharacterized protein YkwD